ncbi:MAG TPA: FtsX-like permease family protein [Rhodanobacteraceae bacterium]
MHLPPVIVSLRRHKAGVFLIGLQIALTLAIACNLLSIVAHYAQHIDRPTGLDEANLFLIGQSFVNAPHGDTAVSLHKLDSMQLTDLAALRALPDVANVAPVTTMPLMGSTDMANVALKAGQLHGLTQAALFLGDQNTVKTFGLHLIAGRDFTRAEVEPLSPGVAFAAPVVIVSKTLADKLYPHGNAVGQPLWLNNNTAPSTIVGVVARLITSDPQGQAAYAYNTILIPARNDAATTFYAVRARPGRMRHAMREARTALFRVDPLRIMRAQGKYSSMGLHTFAQIRAQGYTLQIAMAQILSVVAVILLLVTGIGMTGLTSFWVRQRHKQIGIRRALGATRANIRHYFQIENLIIAGGGCAVGVVLAIGFNLALMSMFQMHRMPVWYVAIGVAVILALGQLAVLIPARRAANVPPVVATRSV